jgi:hypothetical protein
MLLTKSDSAKAICEERWHGKGRTPKVDPCGGCKLYRPCVLDGVVVPGSQAFNAWISGINAAAEVEPPNVQLEGPPDREADGEPASCACRRSPRSDG